MTTTARTITVTPQKPATDRDFARVCANVLARLAKRDAHSRARRNASRFLLDRQFSCARGAQWRHLGAAQRSRVHAEDQGALGQGRV
jgi:hypothetical protein